MVPTRGGDVAEAPASVFSRAELREHHPAWFPRILEAIQIRARSPKQFLEQLHIRLWEFSGLITGEAVPSENSMVDGDDESDSESNTGSESISEDSDT